MSLLHILFTLILLNGFKRIALLSLVAIFFLIIGIGSTFVLGPHNRIEREVEEFLEDEADILLHKPPHTSHFDLAPNKGS